jgi:two-component system response regulator HydG
MTPANILLVDDEPGARASLAKILTANSYQVQVANDGVTALERIESAAPDLVLTDLHMPEMDGMELLRELKSRAPILPVILMTGFAGIESAVKAMREGAADYLTKPLNVDELLIVIDRALEGSRLRQEAAALKSQIRALSRFDNIIGSSSEMLQLFQSVTQIAPSRATVLLTGETGTGKELVAAAIHHRSTRAAGPFVRVHCGALAESLLESELFGHERGSFTGAVRQRQGRFEQANGGSLFLDEIGEISMATQVKLLRVLQEREFERVGGNDPIRVDVRLIAATNRDLPRMVADGQFREDLFSRLNVINLRLPALRERATDIPVLAADFLRRFAEQEGRPAVRFSSEATARLVSHAWPGNVRELENVVERAVVLADGEQVEAQHLPPEIVPPPSKHKGLPEIPGATMLDFERYAILETLAATNNSTAKTAKALGISVRKIQYRLQEYRGLARANRESPSSARRVAFRGAR